MPYSSETEFYQYTVLFYVQLIYFEEKKNLGRVRGGTEGPRLRSQCSHSGTLLCVRALYDLGHLPE